eukprot:1079352-Prorocentrum_minimum.AAC.1
MPLHCASQSTSLGFATAAAVSATMVCRSVVSGFSQGVRSIAPTSWVPTPRPNPSPAPPADAPVDRPEGNLDARLAGAEWYPESKTGRDVDVGVTSS